MGDVAGSGGYYVAMGADRIVAQPGTITGSIGVVAGKMVITDWWKKIGVTWDDVFTSPNATTWSPNHDYTDAQWNHLQDELDRTYNDFIDKAARGRNLERKKIMAVAKGKIWTGMEAKKHGLVDALGGFPLAIKLVKQMSGIDEAAGIRLKLFPKRKTLTQQIMENLPSDDTKTPAEAVFVQTLNMLRHLCQHLKQSGLYQHDGVLRIQQPYPSSPSTSAAVAFTTSVSGPIEATPPCAKRPFPSTHS